MLDRDALHEELDWLSSRISDRIWTVSVAVLAFSLPFVIDNTARGDNAFLSAEQVMPAAVLSLLALASDLVQYISGYLLNYRTFKSLKEKKSKTMTYDQSSAYFRLRGAAFQAKVTFSLVSVIWLVIVLAQRFLI